jgi:hypothetical protein
MKDLGQLHHFLGISVQCQPTDLFLSQQQYTVEIVERAGMIDSKPCTTPVDTGDPISGPTHYRSLADALQYLTFTHPDISYTFQQVCLHMHDPREPYMTALKHILCYLQGTLDFGLLLRRSSTSDLVVYSDAD